MSLTINTKTFTNDVQLKNVEGIRYTGPNHSFSSSEYCDLTRNEPKKTATSFGQSKTSLRLVSGATDGTDKLDDMIARFDFSVPVGVDSTELTAFIADAKSAANSAIVTALVEARDVNQ